MKKGDDRGTCGQMAERSGTVRRGALVKKRGMLVVDSDCHLCREWLLSDMPTYTSRKHKKTIRRTAWNDSSPDSIVMGFKNCCVSI
jgi:hypothetical protein